MSNEQWGLLYADDSGRVAVGKPWQQYLRREDAFGIITLRPITGPSVLIHTDEDGNVDLSPLGVEPGTSFRATRYDDGAILLRPTSASETEQASE